MKKVLAWAVALALVLSSFTMAFAADTKTSADFKDASSINYTEAVDVMVATGIINGYPDGTFGPLKTVKRSEMAKMIAVMMNGGEDVGDQFKSACPFADSKDHWAAGYIAYCASEHIIDGRSADVFDPEAEVTGTEVAKMALTSLGYDSKIQGYTGENWAAAVLKDAKKAKLFKGLADDFVPGDPCTREAAAQILFNCLQATMVEYDTNTSVSVGDATVSVNSKVQPVVDEKGNEIPLYEEVFGGDLKKTEGTTDEFGKPAHDWDYGKDDIGTYPDTADEDFAVENADSIEKAIEAYDEDLAEEIADYDYKYVLNGGKASTTEPPICKGDKVELFIDEDAEEVLVVITQYQPALIETVDTDVSDKDAEDGITAYLEFADLSAIDKADSDMAGFDAATYVEGAVIAVALNGDEVIDSYVMEEAATGNATKVSKDGKTITIDGTAYEVAGDNYVAFDGKVVASEDVVYNLYDYNGYVLASTVEEEAAADVYYGVYAAYKYSEEAWSDEEGTEQVKIFTSEGKFVVYTVNTEDFELIGSEFPQRGDLVAYTLNDDDEIITIEKASAGFDNKEMKAGGTINGVAVSEDVAVFYTPYEFEYEQYGFKYDADEWTVYGYKDLEEAGQITALEAIQADDEYVAIQVKDDLVSTETETVFGFVSAIEDYDTTDGAFADVTVWVEGKEKTYTTAEDVADTLGDYDADQLVMVTLNADGDIAEISEVTTFDELDAPADEDFTNDAAIYVPGEDCDAVAGADGYIPVAASTKSTITFGDNKIDKQNVAKAVVYFLEDEELSVSSASKIKKANGAVAKIYQVEAESGVWNIVVFYNAPADGGDDTPSTSPATSPETSIQG